MWPFKKQPVVGKTSANAAYARWLRAGSPQPMLDFVAYGEDEQETLAQIGDDYVEDCAETSASAISDVLNAVFEGMAVGGGAGPVDEGDLAESLARGALNGQSPQNAPGAHQGRKRRTMGGVTKRRAERIKADADDRDAPRRLLGFLPDSLRPENQGDSVEEELLS